MLLSVFLLTVLRCKLFASSSHGSYIRGTLLFDILFLSHFKFLLVDDLLDQCEIDGRFGFGLDFLVAHKADELLEVLNGFFFWHLGYLTFEPLATYCIDSLVKTTDFSKYILDRHDNFIIRRRVRRR